ncbi:MAG: hypothetical protein ACLPI9_00175 [Halobacteriota archaeon]|jgi:hypothetical protein
MIITETQRFGYSLLALTVYCHSFCRAEIYALDLLVLLIIIESLVLVDLTKLSMITIPWRKNISVFA